MEQRRRHRVRAALAAFVLAALAAPGPATAGAGDPATGARRDVRHVAADLLQLRTFTEGFGVQSRRIRIGHLEVGLEGGVVFPLVDGSSAYRGFYFVGRGRYEYLSDDPVDRSVISRNLGRRTSVEAEGGGRLEGRFQRAVILHDRAFYPDLRLGQDGSVRPARAAPLDPGELARIREIRALFPADLPSLLAHATLDPAPEPLALATLQSGREHIRYVHDPVQSRLENLWVLRTGASASLRLVSAQALAGEASPAATIATAAFEIESRTDHTGSIRSDLTLRMARAGVRILPFRLALDRPPMVWGALPPKRSDIRALRVTDPGGADVPFSFVGGQLLVDLGRKTGAGETVRLIVRSEGAVLTALSGNRRLDYFELMSTDWHPRPITGSNQRFEYTMTVRTEKPYVPVAPGFDRTLRDLGDAWELRVNGKVPVPFTAALGGRFHTMERDDGPVPVRIHAYGGSSRRWSDTLGRTAVEILGIYEDLLGPYPFEGLDVVEVPEWSGLGVAGPGLVLFSAEAFAPPRPGSLGADRSGMINRFAHEIAHQWFGNRLVIATPRDNWLSESFAEYLSALAIRGLEKPDGSTATSFRRVLNEWIDEAVESSGNATVLAANQLGGDDRLEARNALLYRRGPMILRMLHDLLGEDGFREVLRRFLARADRGTVGVRDFMDTVRETAGRELDWFFHQWLGIDGVPRVAVEYEMRSRPDGGFELEGTLDQSDGRRFKILQVPLVLEMADGSRIERRVVADRPVSGFRIEVDDLPRKVLVDPERVNLAVFEGPGSRR